MKSIIRIGVIAFAVFLARAHWPGLSLFESFGLALGLSAALVISDRDRS